MLEVEPDCLKEDPVDIAVELETSNGKHLVAQPKIEACTECQIFPSFFIGLNVNFE